MSIRILCIYFDTSPQNGTCGGRNLTWQIDNKHLIISGKGEMDKFEQINAGDWDYETSTPWYDSRESIEEITMKDGVTSIGDYAFAKFRNLKKVEISSSVTSIGGSVFLGCFKLKKNNNS